MSGGGSLSNLAKTGDGSPLGDGLFTMGSTGGAPIRGKEGSGGVGALLGSGEEGRSHGGFQAFSGIAAPRPIRLGRRGRTRARGASWHAGSGFVSHGRLKNAKGQIVASGSQHGGHTASQFFGAQQHQQRIRVCPSRPPCNKEISDRRRKKQKRKHRIKNTRKTLPLEQKQAPEKLPCRFLSTIIFTKPFTARTTFRNNCIHINTTTTTIASTVRRIPNPHTAVRITTEGLCTETRAGTIPCTARRLWRVY